SPYRPVSRRFWNELYLDPVRTPEFRLSAGLGRRIRSAEFRRRVAELEAREHVDFRAVARLKREIVEQMLREFGRAPAARRAAFRHFVARSEGLVEYSRFRAALEGHRPSAERYHRFVQWLVDEQIRRVARRLRREGVTLGLDLPIGSHPRGFDARRDAPLLARGVSIGSPPDPGVPEGQNWRLPAWDPERLRRARFEPFVQMLRHELSVAGILRIDHVLGLHRLFWIPAGAAPRDGAYVRYPAAELYAVILAEASRVGATVIGEDLGTVPPELRPELKRRGFLGVYVAQLEWDGPGPARRIPSLSVVSLNTHDHLPFAGYWRARAARRPPPASDGFPPSPTPVAEAFRAASLALARSPARLQLVNVEDLWGETRPQNEPGRSEGSFSRRGRLDLDGLRRRTDAAELLCTIDAVRRRRHV
ncbi:MAG: 4-alpha-glucanotransferase, partial [Thermoplasmata archaeon]